MTSRERIISAINHQQPDKVPVDLGGSTVSGISVQAYHNLKRELGIVKPTRVFDVVQQLANVDFEVIERFGVDVLDVNRLFTENDSEWYDIEITDGLVAQFPNWFRPQKDNDGSWYTKDENGEVLSKMANGAASFDQMIFPWESGYPETFDNIKDAFKLINWMAHSHTNYINFNENELREKISKLRLTTNKAIVMSGGVKSIEMGFFLRRMDNFFMDLMVDKETVSRFLDKITDMHLASLEKKCRSVGDLVDVIRFGDDLGMTSGPFIDLETFRKLFKPRYKILCDYVKQNSNMKIFLHSCGSIRQFIPDLIEVGFDIINPVQTNCAGMDAAGLKKDFGKEITFWGGGIDTASVLSRGTPDDIRKDVLNRCEILSKDGGFVFAAIHNILAEVPPINIIAAFDAVREFNGDS